MNQSARRILYYNCTAGVSGDMYLGAFLDLGIPVDYLRTELKKLGVAGWSLETRVAERQGVSGTQVTVLLGQGHQHQQVDAHWPHHASNRDHTHRPYRDIIHIIQQSGLSGGVIQRALSIFERLAHAEAEVHGQAVSDVVFHEVGAVDSIIDIVGAALCVEWLAPDVILSSRVELGSGTVDCAHGTLPVPAPATARLVQRMPVHIGAVPFEATTPTGAAILAATVTEFTEQRPTHSVRSGRGIGHRDGPIPNVFEIVSTF